MLRLYAAERALQSKLIYRGYDLEVRRAPSGWQVGIYPRVPLYLFSVAVRFLLPTRSRPW